MDKCQYKRRADDLICEKNEKCYKTVVAKYNLL